jgi:hypothetical protein
VAQDWKLTELPLVGLHQNTNAKDSLPIAGHKFLKMSQIRFLDI